MPIKKVIEFAEVTMPLAGAVTKFGGQPSWISDPQWPLSRETGNPMRFIGQVDLTQVSGLVTPAQMAYLFMTDEDDGEYVDGTWEADGGENAVILQPGKCMFPSKRIAEGPSLYRMVERADMQRLQQESCEFGVLLTTADDVPYLSEEERRSLSDDERRTVTGVLDECKLGGTPVFMQGDELPFDGDWQFLLQLDSATVPFYVNFGDVGIGYAFLNTDGTDAKFLWQCG